MGKPRTASVNVCGLGGSCRAPIAHDIFLRFDTARHPQEPSTVPLLCTRLLPMNRCAGEWTLMARPFAGCNWEYLMNTSSLSFSHTDSSVFPGWRTRSHLSK